MKNIIISIVIGVVLFFVSFDYGKTHYPNELYNVYLDEELLGVIESEDSLYEYMNEQANSLLTAEEIYRTFCPITDEALNLMEEYSYEKYIQNGEECVKILVPREEEINELLNPIGLKVEKVLTYDTAVSSVEEIYAEIMNEKNYTINGYEFIVRNGEDEFSVNVLTKELFEEAVTEVINIYVGKDEYDLYLSGGEVNISSVGSVLQNVYLEDSINYKEKNISLDEKIYTNKENLTQFLVYGENPKSSTYKVSENENIEQIAFENKISVNEFLISNPKYKDINSLIAEGTIVQIIETDTQIKVVSEEFEVYDQVSEYQTVFVYDENEYTNYSEVTQEGSNGLDRISQNVKKVNGEITFVEPVSKEILKAATDEIIVKGQKEIPNVGYLDRWAWPTASGYTITTGYGWRIHPITGARDFHDALDIAGTGYGSPIYSVNNGTVITKEYHWSFGNYIVINHNNGYHTLYAHLNAFASGLNVGDTVSYGEIIGYMGSTGQSTGPHLHIEVWTCGTLSCRTNPWVILG